MVVNVAAFQWLAATIEIFDGYPLGFGMWAGFDWERSSAILRSQSVTAPIVRAFHVTRTIEQRMCCRRGNDLKLFNGVSRNKHQAVQ